MSNMPMGEICELDEDHLDLESTHQESLRYGSMQEDDVLHSHKAGDLARSGRRGSIQIEPMELDNNQNHQKKKLNMTSDLQQLDQIISTDKAEDRQGRLTTALLQAPEEDNSYRVASFGKINKSDNEGTPMSSSGNDFAFEPH